MKIAVAAMGNTVSGHFGHCEDFLIFDTADGAITGEERVPNPGHRPGFLPNFLADRGVEVIIAGGMGGGAVEIFNERNVEVIVGAQGDAAPPQRPICGENWSPRAPSAMSINTPGSAENNLISNLQRDAVS